MRSPIKKPPCWKRSISFSYRRLKLFIFFLLISERMGFREPETKFDGGGFNLCSGDISNSVAIKIPNLQALSDRTAGNRYTFQDLHLDFAQDKTFQTTFGDFVETNEIQVDYDDKAIRNSLLNLFNTLPGQRILFPEYGLDFYRYLFEPITLDNARSIGEDIVAAIDKYESRVEVINCNVDPKPDENVYDITLVVSLPVLSRTIEIETSFDIKNQNFISLNTSRNR